MSFDNRLPDSHGRVIEDLRISVTDRCNFRCLYCLPETEEAANFYRTRVPGSNGLPPLEWKPQSALLTFEQVSRLVGVAARLGIRKLRLTGGEPLLRRNLEELVRQLAAIEGIEDMAMTTNGFLFPKKAAALKAAGLGRVSLSLDSLDPENFRRITGRSGLEEVLESITVAREVGLGPVKVNTVVIRGLNDHEIEALARFAYEQEVTLRFIEFMPLDSSREWLKEAVVSAREILDRIQKVFDLEPMEQNSAAETAKRWRFRDGNGEIGLIAPVTEPFCGHCNRMRLTADGKIRTCLFSLNEHDVKAWLGPTIPDKQVARRLQRVVWGKEERHHIGEPDFVQPERTMSCIGG